MCIRKYFFLAIYVCTEGTHKRQVSTRIFMGPTCRYEGKKNTTMEYKSLVCKRDKKAHHPSKCVQEEYAKKEK
jgi:hypothetical protein